MTRCVTTIHSLEPQCLASVSEEDDIWCVALFREGSDLVTTKNTSSNGQFLEFLSVSVPLGSMLFYFNIQCLFSEKTQFSQFSALINCWTGKTTQFNSNSCPLSRQHCRLSVCSHFGWVWQIHFQSKSKYQLTVRRAGLSTTSLSSRECNRVNVICIRSDEQRLLKMHLTI